jgi:predicted dithiol-disulfide oxidoreductase (DUF899 family)
MYDESWDQQCSACSFWLDGVNGQYAHIHSKVNIVAVAKASPAKLAATKADRKWDIPLLSSQSNTFNLDFGVERPDNNGEPFEYNFQMATGIPSKVTQLPGLTVFRRCKNGNIYQTYSTYARGLDVCVPFMIACLASSLNEFRSVDN